MDRVVGVVTGIAKVNGRTRFLFEVSNVCLGEEFFEHCRYLEKHHDKIYVSYKKTKTIITVNSPAFVQTGSVVRGLLAVTLHHLAGSAKPTVVWSLENVEIL